LANLSSRVSSNRAVLRLTESVVADEGEEMQGKNLAQPSDLTRPRNYQNTGEGGEQKE
jgi:hypothetical protein